MAALKRAVFVSDLHLGSNPPLDDFLRDDEFARLLATPELQVPAGGTIDLVLLGDTFDLWQAVTDEECGTDPDSVPVEYDSDGEARRVRNVLEKHHVFTTALRKFSSSAGAHVVFVAGNHDHALVHPDVQEAVRRALGGSGNIHFELAYENAALHVYAEHGNQYEKNTQYKDFAAFDWKQECRGYYFVRLFFNRIERRDPQIENAPGGWRGAWHWLRHAGDPKLVAYALRCISQYVRDPRVKRHVRIGMAAGAPASQVDLVELREAPGLLVGVGGPAGPAGHFFSADRETEAFLRDAYLAWPEVKTEVDRILAEQGRAGEVPPQGAPATPIQPMALRPRTSEDVEWAEKLFTSKPALRETKLELDQHRCVIFGHTHGKQLVNLSNDAKYLNTGTWTTDHEAVPVAIVEEQGPAKLLEFDGNGFIG